MVHLDDDGIMHCFWRASSMDSLLRWLDDPSPLYTALWHARADGCTCSRWLVIDSRPATMDPVIPKVSTADEVAFTALRAMLAEEGIDLIDTVVFDGCQNWWSLREMTMGTTRWLPAPESAA